MRYLIAVFGVFVLLILGIIILTNGGGEKKAKTPQNKIVKLTDYKTDGTVRYTVDGPIVASENHYAVRITINAGVRTVDVIRGYEGQVVKTQSYGNDTAAFGAFLEALNRAGYMGKRTNPLKPDSICPTGNRSYYDLESNGEELLSTWMASCNEGTFAGNAPLVRRLFQSQIPDYSKIISGPGLGGASLL